MVFKIATLPIYYCLQSLFLMCFITFYLNFNDVSPVSPSLTFPAPDWIACVVPNKETVLIHQPCGHLINLNF